MSYKGENAILESEKSFEDLLGHAPPRPAPSTADIDKARTAVRAEWLNITHKRRRQRRFVSFAAAAAVLVALAIVVNYTNMPVVSAAQVASIDKSIGSIYVLGEQSRLQATGNLSSIAAGQTIITGEDSGLGLLWGDGGSLRIDADSRVTFVSAEAIELESGRVYFDSLDLDVTLEIQTKFGSVTHLGTQYITSVGKQSLTVSVRNGRVSVDGLYYDEVAEELQQMTLSGSARPEVLSILPYGDHWSWVEATAPLNSFDGKTIYELLQWVARETGIEIEFDNAKTERIALEKTLTGDVDAEPRIALKQGLLMFGLDYDDLGFEKGVIRIVDIEAQ